MTVSISISRFANYLKRNGLRATVRRGGLAVSRALRSNRTILFYSDLAGRTSRAEECPTFLEVQRKRASGELMLEEFHEIINVWNPGLAQRNIKERFDLGASLWLIKFENRLAGYGWTLQGRTVEPHYFRLGPDDVHFFDFHVFPQYRGRGLNPFLVSYILRRLAAECKGRAFIEAAEWNQAQLVSLQRTPFHRLGSAVKFTIFRRAFVCWARDEPAEQEHKLKDMPYVGKQLDGHPGSQARRVCSHGG
jgi:ribosomal protein S18 acetylase RimI-like enzyme